MSASVQGSSDAGGVAAPVAADAVVTEPVPALASLSRQEFLEHHRYQRPVLVKGAARQLPAFSKWTLEYLEDKVGHADIVASEYAARHDDYTRIVPRALSFREFSRKFRDPGHGQDLYWFNIMESGNFWANPRYAAPCNDALAVLAADFQPPGFLDRKEMVYAQMILGSQANGTKLHYDWGGEAKCLIQIAGRKHVLLVSPAHAARALLTPAFGGRGVESACALDVRALHGGRGPANPVPGGIPVLEATLEAGDVLYWPSFWLHDVANLDPFTLAINAPIDELPISALFVRQCMVNVVSELLNHLDARGWLEASLPHVLSFVKEYDARVVASGASLGSLWNWLPQLRPELGDFLRHGSR
jgi:hypothetical protein